MALKHKGEFQVEDGFGLPKKTTAQRAAYTPPEDGYQVFDTDLGRVATWTAASGWNILGLFGSVDDDKIDILHGYAKSSLSLQTQISEPGLKMSTVAENLIDDAPILNNVFYSRQFDVNLQGRTYVRSTTNHSWVSAAMLEIYSKSSGKWFWESRSGATSTGSGGTAHGVTANINNLVDKVGNDVSSWGVTSWTGDVRHNDVITSTISAFTGPAVYLLHKLDLDNGTYEISVGGGAYNMIDSNLPTGNYLPVLSVWGNFITGFAVREEQAITVSSAPAGYSFWLPDFSPVNGKVKIESEQDDGDLCIVNTSGNTEFALKDGEMTANAPILGIDGTDPASLVTRASVDRFLLNFNAGDWTTVNGVSTLGISHGLNFISTETLFDVQVLELVDGNYKSTSIEHTTDQTTGIITLHTLGLPFDGRVRISK